MLDSQPPPTNIPNKLKHQYQNFKLFYEGGYHKYMYKIYEAEDRATKKKFHIKILNTQSKVEAEDRNLAISMFIRELLRLCSTHPTSLRIEDFAYEDGIIGYVSQPEFLFSDQPKETVNCEKLISSLLSECHFLHDKLKIPNQIGLEPQNIHQMINTDDFFLSNWPETFKERPSRIPIQGLPLDISTTDLFSQVNADEILEIGIRVLQKYSKFSSEEKPQNLLGILSQIGIPARLKVLLSFMLDSDRNRRVILYKTLTKKIDQEGALVLNDKLIESLKTDHAQKTFGAYEVSRFDESGYWDDLDYKEMTTDCISFKSSKTILLTGVGIYGPKGEQSLEGTIEIVKGFSLDGERIVMGQLRINPDPQSDSITESAFQNAILIEADVKYSIITKLKGGDSYCGEQGKESVSGTDGTKFNFEKCTEPGVRSGIEMGQIPKLYYTEWSLESYHLLY